MATLDAIDRRLLAELQAEGRVTNVELAQRVGLTAPPCLRRVRALEEAGVIRGYHADLDASKLGFSITVFALVSLKSQAEESLRQFEDHMRGLPASDLAREQRQIDRLRRLAEDARLDPEFSEKFLRFVIQEVIRHHEQAKEK